MDTDKNQYTILMMCMGGRALAHVTRLIELGKEFRNRGHKVVFAYGGTLPHLILNEGFELEEVPDHSAEFYMSPDSMNIGTWHNQESLERFVGGDLRAIEKHKPDIIVNDTRITASLSGLISKTPVVQIVDAEMTPYYALRFKTFSSFQPPLYGKLKIVEWFSDCVMMPLLWKVGLKMWVKEYNKFIESYDIEAFKDLNEVMAGDIMLLPDFPEFSPVNNLPSNWHQVGPLIWDYEGPMPDWIDQLDKNRPIIYVTQGGTGDPEMFKLAIEAFKDTEYQIIMSLGSNCDIDYLGNIPSNFYITKFIDGRKILKMSDLVIFHGGGGTTYQTLQEGVPAVIIPNITTQESYGDRMRNMGISITIYKKNLTVTGLTSAVREVLQNPKYKIAALEMKEKVIKYSGSRKGVDIVIEYLDNKKKEEKGNGVMNYE